MTRAERIARNEVLFREVNEQIEELATDRRFPGPMLLVCECGDATCAETIEVSRKAYEDARRHSTYFLVKPSHEMLEVERIVERHEPFLVVEKLAEAAEIAAAADPRA